MTPPVNVLNLLEKYARVEFASIPIDADAVCFNLKKPGIKATVIINEDRPRKRIRFTMAHELGHVLIPWHRGLIVDNFSPSNVDTSTYLETEAEANRFASELLMPSEWIVSLIKQTEDPGELTRQIANEADVSSLAAVIRLRNSLPKGFIFAELDGSNVVQRSWRSPQTVANEPHPGSFVNPSLEFGIAINCWSLQTTNGAYWWWKLPDTLDLPQVTDTDWRSILNSITEGYSADVAAQKKAYASISATAAAANKSKGASKEQIYAAIVQRFSSKARNDRLFKYVISHPLIEQYMAVRASTF